MTILWIKFWAIFYVKGILFSNFFAYRFLLMTRVKFQGQIFSKKNLLFPITIFARDNTWPAKTSFVTSRLEGSRIPACHICQSKIFFLEIFEWTNAKSWLRIKVYKANHEIWIINVGPPNKFLINSWDHACSNSKIFHKMFKKIL